MKQLLLVAMFLFVGCEREADVASRNVSRAADSFEVVRRIVFYNGITSEYILTIEGYCSIGNNDSRGQLSITCKVKNGQYKKHFLGLSDNVTFFAEQIESSNVSENHYKVIFRPLTIIPDIEMRR